MSNALALRISVGLLLFLLTESSRASDFPSSVQSCINAGDCSTPSLMHEDHRFAVYDYLSNGIESALLRYTLGGESREIATVGTTTTTNPLSGFAWLHLQKKYSVGPRVQEAGFAIFSDYISPAPLPITHDRALPNFDPSLRQGTIALRVFIDQIDFGSWSHSQSSGVEHSILRYRDSAVSPDINCISGGCSEGARFSMPFVRYNLNADLTQAMLELVPSDRQRDLFDNSVAFAPQGDPVIYEFRQLLQVVPEPSTVTLCVSGVISLLVRRRGSR